MRRAAAALLLVLVACVPPPRLPPVTWLVTPRPDCVKAGIGIWQAGPITAAGDYNIRIINDDGTTTDLLPLVRGVGDPWVITAASPTLPFHALYRPLRPGAVWVQASALVHRMPTAVCP